MRSDTDLESLIPDPDLLIAEARSAVLTGVAVDWPELLPRLASSLPRSAVASPRTFEAVRELVLSEKFLAVEGSWHLMHFLLTNWAWLSQNQKSMLAEPIADSFDRFAHWMGAFVAGEILGDRYCDAWSMNRLAALAKSARMPARSLVPHGLELLAKTTQLPELRLAATEALRRLTKDDQSSVRDEANESLGRVGAI